MLLCPDLFSLLENTRGFKKLIKYQYLDSWLEEHWVLATEFDSFKKHKLDNGTELILYVPHIISAGGIGFVLLADFVIA